MSCYWKWIGPTPSVRVNLWGVIGLYHWDALIQHGATGLLPSVWLLIVPTWTREDTLFTVQDYRVLSILYPQSWLVTPHLLSQFQGSFDKPVHTRSWWQVMGWEYSIHSGRWKTLGPVFLVCSGQLPEELVYESRWLQAAFLCWLCAVFFLQVLQQCPVLSFLYPARLKSVGKVWAGLKGSCLAWIWFRTFPCVAAVAVFIPVFMAAGTTFILVRLFGSL